MVETGSSVLPRGERKHAANRPVPARLVHRGVVDFKLVHGAERDVRRGPFAVVENRLFANCKRDRRTLVVHLENPAPGCGALGKLEPLELQVDRIDAEGRLNPVADPK